VDHRYGAADTSPKPAATGPKTTPAKTTATSVEAAPTTNMDPASAARTPSIGADRQEWRDGEHQSCNANDKSEAIR
jgi:hypothetical protein